MSLHQCQRIESSNDLRACLYERNGRLVYGTENELREIEGNALLGIFPKIENELLNRLEQSLLCNGNLGTFIDNQQSGLQEAVSSWATKGIENLVDRVKNAMSSTIPYSGWLSSASQFINKAQIDITNIFAKSEESLCDSVMQTSSAFNWSKNWVRCIAVHNNGRRIAICQNNDCIRVFCCDSNRLPITLKHQHQQNVTDMAWKPFDRMVLAVACAHAVLIWKLDKQNLNIRQAVNCTVIEMSSLAPVIQCLWDSVFDQALFVVSASSSCLQVLDTNNGESELVGSWTGSRIRHVWISPNGDKIAIAYDGNMMSVYDRHSWHEDRWKKLKGLCVAAAWAPLSDVLFFATNNEPTIRAVYFVKKLQPQSVENNQFSYGSQSTVTLYDLSGIVLKHADSGSGNSSNSDSKACKVNEFIRDMKISPDGQRIAVVFSGISKIVALFMVETTPSFFFAPCGLINGAENFGSATVLSFFPKFQYGALLAIVWSTGKMQYIPLLYGYLANEGFHLNCTKKEKLLGEMSTEQLLLQESQLSGMISSRSNGGIERTMSSGSSIHSQEDVNENSGAASTSDVDVKLFSSVGLYDLLTLKSVEEEK
ncbi:unnamed protein product [Litomosoides sigmodontis]|uniref:Aladin seven-bladed propeller domain-containing protein n=1 Tax=Litomosoides sigmodontis TaxID=42156 RepID=A0A3P6VDI9_LITSI|nr:unnamed protein product [Litomosoides sigmodontis]